MNDVQTILRLTNFSPSAAGALPCAFSFAKKLEAGLFIPHDLPPSANRPSATLQAGSTFVAALILVRKHHTDGIVMGGAAGRYDPHDPKTAKYDGGVFP